MCEIVLLNNVNYWKINMPILEWWIYLDIRVHMRGFFFKMCLVVQYEWESWVNPSSLYSRGRATSDKCVAIKCGWMLEYVPIAYKDEDLKLRKWPQSHFSMVYFAIIENEKGLPNIFVTFHGILQRSARLNLACWKKLYWDWVSGSPRNISISNWSIASSILGPDSSLRTPKV